MRGTIKKWGNSQGIRLPKNILEDVNLKENDEIEIRVINGMIQIKSIKKYLTLKERLEGYSEDQLKSNEWDLGKKEGQEFW
ncbi:AbrB/MazE/SpoVT family DNA-binding domain-containing protein [Paenibacillus nicotianae]|uniref:AbrB/MazE/SpoVT family DNA-binding domain-containing protein n=1 Tax=Paenibacillus nicotianae TaxID=1526551 RepID=A0ABW4UZ04_9BACL